MKTLQVFEANAIKAYNGADNQGKEILSNLFGKEIFSQNITDRVKTMEDVYLLNGTTAEEVIPFKNPKNKRQVASNGLAKVMEIVHALNEEWEADYNDESQRKYELWFKYSSGVGVSCDGYGRWDALTCVGSRLCFKDIKLAKFAIDQFPSEFNEWLNPQI